MTALASTLNVSKVGEGGAKKKKNKVKKRKRVQIIMKADQ